MPHFAFTERVMRSMFDCNRLIGEGCGGSIARNRAANTKTKVRRMLARANRSLINIPPLQLAGQGASSLDIPPAGYHVLRIPLCRSSTDGRDPVQKLAPAQEPKS